MSDLTHAEIARYQRELRIPLTSLVQEFDQWTSINKARLLERNTVYQSHELHALTDREKAGDVGSFQAAHPQLYNEYQTSFHSAVASVNLRGAEPYPGFDLVTFNEQLLHLPNNKEDSVSAGTAAILSTRETLLGWIQEFAISKHEDLETLKAQYGKHFQATALKDLAYILAESLYTAAGVFAISAYPFLHDGANTKSIIDNLVHQKPSRWDANGNYDSHLAAMANTTIGLWGHMHANLIFPNVVDPNKLTVTKDFYGFLKDSIRFDEGEEYHGGCPVHQESGQLEVHASGVTLMGKLFASIIDKH